MNSLECKTILGFGELIIALGLFLFAPAWTFDYWQAWVYIGVFAISAALITAYLWKKDPKLLERRVNAGPTAEKEKYQKVIQIFASIAFIGMMILPSIDHRFSRSSVPVPVVILGDVIVALGFFIVFIVFKVNTFTSATIELASEQKVISTGPYAIVRHPMYSGALVMLLSTPIALGSWWGLIMFVPMTFVIVFRLLDEEKFLKRGLSGYQEYCEKVKYRLLPLIW